MQICDVLEGILRRRTTVPTGLSMMEIYQIESVINFNSTDMCGDQFKVSVRASVWRGSNLAFNSSFIFSGFDRDSK